MDSQDVVSGLTDLDQVPLADLHVMGDETLTAALRRIVPDSSGERVAVAAFNSSI